jgi:hypothetical protein
MLGHMATDDPDTAPDQVRDLPWLAHVLDEASRHRSHHRMAVAGRELLGLALLDEFPDDLPVEERAVAWALEYHVESVDGEGRRRIRLASKFEHDDGSDPPAVADAPEEVVSVWRALLDLVKEPPARARLHHLLFERGRPEAFRHARSAAEAYLASAEHQDRGLDAVEDLVAATRLGRAISDSALTTESLDRAANLAEQHLAADEPPAGIVIRALRHLVGEPDCPDRVDALLARAAEAWPDANRRDQVLAIMLKRCDDAPSRADVWRRRVAAFSEEAEAATSTIMRAFRLQQALRLAERSGDVELRREAASRLQAIRHEALEMMTFKASSHRYEEEFERLVEEASKGADWRQALITFATLGPISGDVEQNRALIEERHRQHPLANLFPVDLRSPEGLPIFTGTSEEDRFDLDLTMWETELVGYWLPILVAGLHAIPERHGLPTLEEISTFLMQWPAVHGAVGPAIARALLRYWTGDAEGAAYTIAPRIEALVRSLVLQRDRGVFRLQRDHKPGQYPGLGHLLPILVDEYALPESVARFLDAVVCHPGGLNVRNLMLHGYVDDLGPGIAALLIHTALGLATIRPSVEDVVSEESSDE